jgi:2-oxoglutarate ferredoxin oxidoreductase subunit beta
MADMGLHPDEVAVISGIGCSSRFPYYMKTYGMHSIHGRAPAFVSGLRLANPDISIWQITGDGDGLSIGGNHLIHALRRNLNFNLLLFNNQIYGLTKGQYSPTSETNKSTKSSPMGSIDHPINPIALALGADASFVARSMDRDPKHLKAMLTKANEHVGTSFVEIYQNCNIFNDGAFFTFTDKATKPHTTLFLEQGMPLLFGENNSKGIRLDGFRPIVVDIEESGLSSDDLWIHDERDLTKAQLLSRFFDDPTGKEDFLPRPFGIFYIEDRPTYEEQARAQLFNAKEQKGADLAALLRGGTTWEIK